MWIKAYDFFRKRALNIPLLVGTIILVLLALASSYPEYLSPADPYGMQRMQYSNADNTSVIITPPIPPSKDYPWGTDELGRDMKSLIVYGTKQTIFIACIAALLRLIIALPIAVLAGYQNKMAIRIIKIFNIIFSAIPLAVAVLIFKSIGIFNFLIKDDASMTIVWLVLLGWSRFAYLLSEKVREILEQDFIEGEIAIGKNKFEIATQNILPHLISSTVVMYFLEIAMVLLLLIQIGLLSSAFRGGYYTATGDRAVPIEFNWTSLLQSSYLLFNSTKMWLVTFPAAAFAVAVIGFNLFGEGLRIEFEKRTSKVITFIKKVPGFFSLPKLMYELKSYKENKRSLTIKAAAYLLILVILFMPPFPSRYQFNEDNSMAIVKELSDPKYEGRHTGSEGVKHTAEYIAEALQSYGVKPLGESYIQSFEVSRTYNIKHGEFKVYTSSGKQIKFENRKDFYILSPFNLGGRAKLINVEASRLKNLDLSKVDEYSESVILMDIRYADPNDVTGAMMNLAYRVNPKAVVLIQGWESMDEYYKINGIAKNFDQTLTIHLSSDKGDELLKYKDLVAEYKVEAEDYGSGDDTSFNPFAPGRRLRVTTQNFIKGYNVVGYIPGSNPKYSKECIVVGCSIDYLGNDKKFNYPGALSTSAIAVELEIARVMSKYGIKPEKTIIFSFWDGTYTDYRGSKAFKENYINKNKLDTYYIELTNMASTDTERLLLDTTKTIPKSKTSQAYIRSFKGIARQKNVSVVYSKLLTRTMDDFLGAEKEALIFGSDGVAEYLNTPKDNYELINSEKLGEFGQVILDTIIKIAASKN